MPLSSPSGTASLRAATPRLSRSLPAWLPVAVALLALIAALGVTAQVDRSQRQHQAQEARQQALAEAGAIRDRLESAINQKLTLSRSLVAYVASHPNLGERDFAFMARNIIAQEPGIRALQLARDNVISHTYPLAGNAAAVGLKLMQRPDQRPQIERAILSRRTIVAGPLRIVQGGQALIGRSPIYIPSAEGIPGAGEYWGLANVLVNVEELFNNQLLDHTSGLFQFAVRGKDALGASGELIWGDARVFADDPVLLDVQLPDGSWQIGVQAVEGWMPPHQSQTWASGSLIGLLAAGLLWLLIRTPLVLRMQVRRATAELRHNEQKFRTISETVPAPILITHAADGCVLYANSRFGDILGIAPSHLIGQNSHSLEPQPESRAELLDAMDIRSPMAGREIQLQQDDGRQLWFSLSATLVEFSRLPAVMLVLQDITRRRAAEQATAALNRELEARVAERTAGLEEQKSFWQALAKAQSDVDEGVFVIEEGRIIFANEALARISGYGVAELTGGLPYTELVHPDVREAIVAKHLRRLAGEKLETRYETLFRTRQGKGYAAELAVSLIPHEPTPRVVVVVRDIEARKQAENALRAQAAAIEAAGEMVVITDRNAMVQHVNPAFTRHTGYSRQEALGHPIASLMKSGVHGQDFYARLWQTILAGREWHGEVTNRRKDGTLFVAEQTIAPILGEHGEITGFVSIKRDISDRKRLETRLEQMAHFDALTGLPNRPLFFDRLAHALRQARRSGNGCALLFIDLDGFKDINDSLGHEAGDTLLQEAALRIVSNIRESDTAARMGGDEFTVILNGIANPADAQRVAGNLLAALEKPFPSPHGTCRISASIGISFYPQDGEDAETLLGQADMAMYAAKRAGKNRCCTHAADALQTSSTPG
jgi:diguanylate cyclase (GGDEF)-like protein/PAS domain S-box-containing protein